MSGSKLTPFTTILIANRGEIALRVMRTARRMGYRTVAVYSSADSQAPHVRAADIAVWIGEAAPAHSYLNIESIVAAARSAGADAVHPGYGFLAENAGFAQACIDAGLVFIGPSPQAIQAMGNKAGAKRLMEQAGVPCIPGYHGDDQSEERLLAEAGRIGYPVMIKATAGGGGRGMRLVSAAADFPAALRSARSEAQNAFGDAEVILERAIVEPRHIEIQVFADRHGNAIHLGERDCSVQRRHQKIIEEAPSPAVSPELRRRMGETAVRAALAIGYEGAGTLEFLLDAEGHFYFMEMNTRLQVEHPVTEAITGLDLVELQLQVAAGEALPRRQEDLRFDGHAIEVRLCAESPEQQFLPQSGRMALWQPPPGLRVEHALESGATIPPYYDSMIAKLIAHGADREQARRRLQGGLDELVSLGVPTNQGFLAACLRHPVFAAGGATTGFIGEHAAELLQGDDAARLRAQALAAVAIYLAAARPARGCDAERLAPGLPIEFRLDFDGAPAAVRLLRTAPGIFEVEAAGTRLHLREAALQGTALGFISEGLREQAVACFDAGALLLAWRGRNHRVQDRSRAAQLRAGAAGSDGRLRASSAGRVVAVEAAAGDEVVAGQALMVLEAMKMEHIHTAPLAGRVGTIAVAPGEQVKAGQLLAEIVVAEPPAKATAGS
jgi:geranyl-CoA carboxylase alpha subunit